MFITKTKTKDTAIYYLSKSFRDRSTGKVSTKIIEKIGAEEEIKKKIGKNKSLDKWLKGYASKKTQQEKNAINEVSITLNPLSKLKSSDKRIFNAGYLIIQKILYDLDVDKIIKDIETKEKFKGDLFHILSYIIYTFIFNYGINEDVLTYTQKLIEKPKFNKRQLYLALEIFAKNSFKIQYELFDKINKYTEANKSIVYYDTNAFYHDFINPDEDYDVSNKVDKLNKYEVGYNSNNIPLAYSLYRTDGNYDEYEIKIGQKILKEYADAQFIVLSSFENPYTSLIVTDQRNYASPIQWINIRNLKKEYQEWATNDDDWIEVNSQKKYTMDEIKKKLNDPDIIKKNNEWIKTARFYKTRKIKWKAKENEGTSEKILVSVFSNDLKETWLQVNKTKIENINITINKQLFKNKQDLNFCKKYLEKYERYVEIIDDKLTSHKSDILYSYKFKNNVIDKLREFSGFYTIMLDTNIKDLHGAIRAQTNKWVNDSAFKFVPHDFQTLPKYFKYQDRCDAHMFTTYLSILIWRVLRYKSHDKFSDDELLNALIDFNFIYFQGQGWIPCYEINRANKFLQKFLNANTDFAFITTKQMNSIIKSIK